MIDGAQSFSNLGLLTFMQLLLQDHCLKVVHHVGKVSSPYRAAFLPCKYISKNSIIFQESLEIQNEKERERQVGSEIGPAEGI